jgi:hypothetical protein
MRINPELDRLEAANVLFNHRRMADNEQAREILANAMSHVMGTRERDESGESSVPESGVSL